MDVEGLIYYGDYVSPQQQKQLVPTPPSYEEALKELCFTKFSQIRKLQNAR